MKSRTSEKYIPSLKVQHFGILLPFSVFWLLDVLSNLKVPAE